MEGFWKTRVELVSALKEGAASSLMAVPQVKSVVPDVEEVSPSEPKDKGSALTVASMSSPILPLSCYAQITHAALASLGAPPIFEPLQTFELHLQEEYGCFRRDQM